MRPAAVFLAPLSLFAGLAIPATASAVSSNFDTDADGWTVIDVATGSLGDAAYVDDGSVAEFDYKSTGGNPGGYIEAIDPSDGTFLFVAPAKFLGNLSGYAGGTLAWDTFYTPNDENDWRGDPDVILSNGTTTIVYQAPANPVGTSWNSFVTTLSPGAGWTIGGVSGTAATADDFAAVLGGVTILRIRGEFYTGVVETTGLDNVVLTAVPEPGTWALMAGGFALLGLRAARRRGR